MEIGIVEAVKKAQSERTVNWAKDTKETCDQSFNEHNGACTYQVAEILNVENPIAKSLLDKAAKNGLIHKSKNNAGAYCRWWPSNYLAELKAV
jgi:hypothetical protein